MRLWDFVTSASRKEILEVIESLGLGSPIMVQRICRCKSGEEKIVDLRIACFGCSGRDLVSVSCRDVTEQKRLEDRLRQSERNLAEGQRLTRTGSWVLDFKTGNTDWSVETCRIFGFPDPPPSPHYSEFRERVRPADRETVDRALRESFETGEPRPLEYVFKLPNGVSKYIETISQPVKDKHGVVVKLMGTVMDVTERKWTEALLAGEKRVLEMIAMGESLSATLAALCRLVEELSPGSLCSILLLDPETNSLWNGASPNLPKAYTEAINGAVIGPNVGSCGKAAYYGKQVIVSDVATDPLWVNFRDIALANGLRACWSTPILSLERKVLGTFAMYCGEPCHPSSQQQDVIEQITHLATIAIERKRGEEALRRSKAYLAEAQRLSHTGSFGWDVSTGELFWSEETFHILEYVPSIKPTLDRVFKRVHPEDVPFVRQTLDRATRDGTDLDFEHRLLMPGGAVKHVHIVARQGRSESNRIEYVGAVMDITDAKRAEGIVMRHTEALTRIVSAGRETLQRLAEKPDMEAFLGHVLTTALDYFGTIGARVWLGDPTLGPCHLYLRYAKGDLRPVVEGTFLPQVSSKHAFVLADPRDSDRFRPVPGRIGFDHKADLETVPSYAPYRADLLQEGVQTIARIPLFFGPEVRGVLTLRFLTHRAFTPEEEEFAHALANQVVLVLELRRLSEQAKAAALIEERNRLARDIHDTLAQGLTGVIVQLEASEDAMAQGLAKEARKHIGRAGNLARDSLREARRSVQALRPQVLEEKDLPAALKDLFTDMTEGTNLRTDFVVRGDLQKLPAVWEENLLRIGQEVLTNALRHAHATRFSAQLDFAAAEVRLELCDDGLGFDPETRHDGFGLLGMRERVEAMAGHLIIQSGVGKGTTISIILPSSVHSRTSES